MQNKYLEMIEKKIIALSDIKAWRDQVSGEQKRIVFTNGVFDILHRGHITYLAQAKTFGDILIIGLNADESVRRLKGPDRPIHSLTERLFLAASLSFVDFVTYFSEQNPIEIIKKIKPHVHVKGGDYQADSLPETPIVKELGGEVKIISFVDGYSSSRIIEKIRQ